MTKRKRRRMKRGYVVLLWLMLAVLIFGIARVIRTAKKNPQEPTVPVMELETDTAAATESATWPPPTEPLHPASRRTDLPGESMTGRTTEYETEDTTEEDDTTEETDETESTAPLAVLRSEDGSMTCGQTHIYVRIANSKKVSLRLSGGVKASEIEWSVDDTNVADVIGSGEVIGLQAGTCHLIASYMGETLSIPVTVRELYVEDGCTFVDGILVANKSYSLPREYDPGLLPVTEKAFDRLCEDAADAGLDIYSHSDYRSYDFQIKIYNSMVSGYSKEYADTVSARPGYSEHQTGYTIDCNTPDNSFADTKEGKWLARHCAEYGFIIRYPLGKEEITGYDYESWHIRYVGREAAEEIMSQGIALEEYLDIDSYYHDDEEDEEDEDE